MCRSGFMTAAHSSCPPDPILANDSPCGPRRHARSVQDLQKKYKSLDHAAIANREST